ncbi:hypothetical protein IFM89_021820, partial [Coptis chinensis]
NHITELTVIGNKTTSPYSLSSKAGGGNSFSTSDSTLSKGFSIDSFFTLLTKLSSLKVLSLVSLGIWGPLPAKINRFSSLQVLNLTSNSIYGKISAEVTSVANLQNLVLADNLLSGSIPDLSSLSALEELNLSSNHLGPEFPSLGISFNELEHVDLSNNLLIGKLPLCIVSNSSSRVLFYSWNCLSAGNSKYQHPYSFCHKEALAVKPTPRNQKNGSSAKLGILLSICGGTVATVGIIGLLLVMVFRKAKKNEIYAIDKSVGRKSSAQLSPKLPTEARHVSPTMRLLGAFGLRTYNVFTVDEIQEATSNFNPSNLIGEGPQGQLYKGCTRDGSTVVVRCMKLQQRHSSQRLLQHMEVISKLRHRHLVSLLGHCIVTHQDYSNETNTMFLVFEYVSNSTLRNHLTDRRKREMLKWSHRLAVTMGVAKGIQFLHTGVAPGIFGNDVKIENILLDENLTAKINNYNLLIPSKVDSESSLRGLETTDHLGSSMRTNEHGERRDVYQLGAILLEIITGKPITSQSELDVQRLQLEQSLAESPQKLRATVDPSLRGTYAYESLRTTAEIIINCLSNDPEQRPTIEDVI